MVQRVEADEQGSVAQPRGEGSVCACGCGNPVRPQKGKGRPGYYFHPSCRKRAQRQREAANAVTEMREDVTKRANTLVQGDALAVLRHLPDQCVQCCVTSPPYWKLRDYGVAGQIGVEQTPQAYIEKLVAVFREVRRVLRDDGVLWLNLGDTYAHDEKWGGATSGKHVVALHGENATRSRRKTGLASKNLLGIPWRVAFALQDDGWILRSDVIWQKPTVMPESVLDRPTSAHEHLFLFAKSPQYYYDADAIRDPLPPLVKAKLHAQDAGDGQWAGANKRNVWTVGSHPFPGAHFAVMPEKLVEPCILAGSSPTVCQQCQAPWKRVVGKTGRAPVPAPGPRNNATKTERSGWVPSRWISNQWRPTCACPENAGVSQSLVLDPFAGSGTVLVVAKQWGRAYLGIELNADYIKLAEERLASVCS